MIEELQNGTVITNLEKQLEGDKMEDEGIQDEEDEIAYKGMSFVSNLHVLPFQNKR